MISRFQLRPLADGTFDVVWDDIRYAPSGSEDLPEGGGAPTTRRGEPP